MKRTVWTAIWSLGWLLGLALSGCGGGGGMIDSGETRAAQRPGGASGGGTGIELLVGGRIKSLTGSGSSLSAFVLEPKPAPGQSSKPAAATISVTKDTTYRAGDKALTAADLKVGLPVEVTLAAKLANNKGTAKAVKVLPPMVAGKIQSRTPASGSLTSFVVTPQAPAGQTQPADVTVSVSSSTKYQAGDKEAKADDVKVGLAVEAVLAAPPVDNKATAVAVQVLPFKAVGKVKSVTTTNSALASFVLQAPTAPSGQTTPPDLTIRVTANTKYAKDGQTATSAEVKAGVTLEAILAAAPTNNAGTASGVNVVTKPTR
ncbi:MAG: hypothetical protein IT204_01585 [Fimbriimonadaceae bacterium]|nr:hypothetical protein [Fimbriimonadaceae bacterium]